jgi:hypothetical protein
MTKSKHSKNTVLAGLLIFCIFNSAVNAEISTNPNNDELLRMLPAEIVFCVRINNLENSLNQTDQFLTGISPMPMWLSMMARGQLSNILGSPELTGLNMSGSFVIFGVSVDAYTPDISFGILAPVTDYKQFIDDNPNLSQPDEYGISKITISKIGGMLIKQAGNYAFLSHDDNVSFAAIAKLLSATETGGLASVLDTTEIRQAVNEPIWIYGNIQIISKIFGEDIHTQLEKTKDLMKQSGNKQAPPGIAQIMNVYISALDTLIKETKSSSLTISPKPNVLNIGLCISTMPGTDMANILVADASAEKENKLLGYFEDSAVMNFAAKMNTPFWKLNSFSIDLMTDILSEDMPAEEIAKLKALVDNSQNTVGDSLAGSFVVDTTNTPPFIYKYLIEVKDKDKFNQLIEDGIQMINTGVIANLYKNMGMETNFTSKRGIDTYKGVSIDSAKFDIKMTDPNFPQQELINTFYGSGFDYRWAVTDGLCLCVMGSNADSAIHELIDQVKAAGPKELSSEMKTALALIPEASEADVVATYNFLQLFKFMGAMMPMPVPQIDTPTSSGLVLTFKIADGKAMSQIALPKNHLMEIMSMSMQMQQMQMQKMQEMQKQETTTPSL